MASFNPPYYSSSSKAKEKMAQSGSKLFPITFPGHKQQQQIHPRHLPPPTLLNDTQPRTVCTYLPSVCSSTSAHPVHQFHEDVEPSRKRSKVEISRLTDNGWVDAFLEHSSYMRDITGQPDQHPNPLLSPSPGRFETSSPVSARRPSPLRLHPSPRGSSPFSACARSPALHPVVHSRRQSSVYSNTTSAPSPAPSQATLGSSRQQGGLSPTDSGAALAGMSELGLSSRANSTSMDNDASLATFAQAYKLRRGGIPWRDTNAANCELLRCWLRLPSELQMRIMMHMDYKSQVCFKGTSTAFWNLVDLELFPWEERTAVILSEERDDPRNFPKKASEALEEEEDDEEMAEIDYAANAESGPSKKRKTSQSNQSGKSTSKKTQGRTKAQPRLLSRWGCYNCYNILPAHFFEGACLEETQGRKTKNNSSRGDSDSEKKVDMRVEYIRILDAVPRTMPEWLTKDLKKVTLDSTNLEACVKERMTRGVNCDDLRAHYKDILRETHLVAPLRDVTPIFTNGRSLQPPPPDQISPSSQIQYPPVYQLRPKKTSRGDIETSSYTYEIPCVPQAASRVEGERVQLPGSQPVSRMCLPPQRAEDGTACGPETVLKPGDIVALRRVCIPCAANLAIYRRTDNRKVTSKTGEGLWACDCGKVWRAGAGTGCPSCGCSVIY